MTIDINKSTFNPKKHYNQVKKLQGRPLLASDDNEQGKINRHWDKVANKDIIGECGFPIDNAGFKITVTDDGANLNISAGRGYIQGVLCENEETILFTEQPDFLEANLPKENGIYLVYLDVWSRQITALQDPQILEVALNGNDTAAREKILCQVKLLAGFSVDFTPFLTFLSEIDNQLEEELADESGGPGVITSNIRVLIQRLRNEIQTFQDNFSNIPVESRLEELRNLLIRIRDSLPNLNIDDPNLINDVNAVLEELNSTLGAASCEIDSSLWDDLIAASTGTLNARTQPEEREDNPCLIPPSAGYQCLGNQLYRVEINNVNPDGTITFKWSRENGSVATAIEEISGNTITVNSLGRDENLGFVIGQWVEITDDRLDQTYQKGQLVQIQDINPDTREITVNPQTFRLFPSQNGESENDSLPVLFPNGLNLDYHPILRRWEQQEQGEQVTEAGVIVTNFEEWINLECGIQIQFSAGTYHQGDAWSIPTRNAIGDIEWPRDENGNSIPQPPEEIQHYYCRLALIQIEDAQITVLSDCRKFFAPLAESPVTNAMHVTNINWNHNNYYNALALREPLEITLDDIPLESTLTPQTIEISVHLPFLGGQQSIQEDIALIADGSISLVSNVIQWRLQESQLSDLINVLRTMEGQQLPPFSVPFFIKLRGHKIWNAGGNYLDGQVFGKNREEDEQGILLPSGDNQRASDCELWFFATLATIEITFETASVTAGQTVEGSVNFSEDSPAAAPNGGVNVRLFSDNPRVARVPSIVLIPEGRREASFRVETSRRSRVATTVTITAVFAGLSVEESLQVVDLLLDI